MAPPPEEQAFYSIHICQVMHTHEYITFFAVGGLAGAAVSSALLMVAVVTWTVCRRKRALHPAPPPPTPTTVELEPGTLILKPDPIDDPDSPLRV